MGLFINPLSHAGYPPGVTGTPETQPSQVRAATVAEANAGVLDYVYISPFTLAGFSSVASFASPPVLGFGSTTPRPVHATTLSATGSSTIGTTGATVNTIGSNNASSTTTITGGASSLEVQNSGTTVTGPLTASTTLTATLGNITATNGNLVLGTAGDKIVSTSVASTTTAGANSFGTVALSTGAATVNTTAAKTGSLIFATVQALGTVTTAQAIAITAIVNNTSFTITSADATDTSTVAWMIVN